MSSAPVSVAEVLARALPATSVAVVEGAHVSVPAAAALPTAALAVPSVTVTVEPLITIVDGLKVTDVVVKSARPRLTVPSASRVVLAAFQTVTVSLPAPPSFSRSTTLVDVPDHPASIDAGLIDSENVYVIESPDSGLPAMPWLTLAV